MAPQLKPVPLLEAGDLSIERALAVRDACLGSLPLGHALARLGDPIVRRWMQRCTPYAGEIDDIACALKQPGTWLLHGAYLFGCTALADETADGPRLRRTLDWPFPGLGRLVEIVRRQGDAGDYLNVTWPGFVGVLTAVAPGRFAAAINQAPMRQRTPLYVLLWLDYALNALAGLRAQAMPPEHLLRRAFDTCRSFDEARYLLETEPVARPVLFTLVGCRPGERVIIERHGAGSRTHLEATTVANAWQEDRTGWRPRCCGTGTPVDNNRRRCAALAAWAGRDADDEAWVAPPVLNETTRVSVEMAPVAGRLVVAGWEPDGSGSAARATAVTRHVSA